jgi:hypothetical protein
MCELMHLTCIGNDYVGLMIHRAAEYAVSLLLGCGSLFAA